MGIYYRVGRLILQHHKKNQIKGHVLLIGRQSIFFTYEEAKKMIVQEGLAVRENVPEEIDHNTIGTEQRNWITDRCFFNLFTDAKISALDVSNYEGAEIIQDLNAPLQDHLFGLFDFIFNGSCLDNLFDVGTAIKNISKLLSPGGTVFHMEHGSPVQSAYMMFSPAVFFDYYAINCYEKCNVLTCLFDRGVLDPWIMFSWSPIYTNAGSSCCSDLMHSNWNHVLLIVIAQKGTTSTDEKSPIQAHYRTYHQTEKSEYLELYHRSKIDKDNTYNFDYAEDLPGIDYNKLIKVDENHENEQKKQSGFDFIGVLIEPTIALEEKYLIKKQRMISNN